MPGRTMPAGRVSGLGELNGYDTGTDVVRDGKGASNRQNSCKPYFADFYFATDLSGIAAVFGDAIQAPIPRDYYGSYMFWMIFPVLQL